MTNPELPEPDRHSIRGWLFMALLIYFLPFILVTIDEVVLHTNWFSRHLPPWVGDVMRAFYPFHKISND